MALAALDKESFGPTDNAWHPGRGVPVEWFNSHQQRHILLHRVGTVPTMAELARRTAYREVLVPGLCWFCRQPDPVRHAWDCLPSRHIVWHLLKGLCASIGKTWYMDRQVERHIEKEMWGASYLVVWCMATTTEGFRQDNLSVATQDSIGVQFLKQVLDASMRLHNTDMSIGRTTFGSSTLVSTPSSSGVMTSGRARTGETKWGTRREKRNQRGQKTARIRTKPTGSRMTMKRNGKAAPGTPRPPASKLHHWKKISSGARRLISGLLRRSDVRPTILELHRRPTTPGPSPRGPQIVEVWTRLGQPC